MYAAEGDLPRTLNAAIKLTAYHHRWYMESAYPSAIAHAIYQLGLVHGLSKIEYTLLSMNLPEGIFVSPPRLRLRPERGMRARTRTRTREEGSKAADTQTLMRSYLQYGKQFHVEGSEY